ncbi:MAG: hypothetical protein AAF568_05750 [Pseudomonadota bacterium]
MTQNEMNPEQLEAYRLAETRIAEAKAGLHKYLDLSSDEYKYLIADDISGGIKRFRHLTRIPPEIADLTWLTRLDLEQTDISDLSLLRGLTALTTLDLDDSLATDLSPLVGMERLETLYFDRIPALYTDPRLKELSEILDTEDRTRQTLAYLRGKLPPEPKLKAPETLEGIERALAHPMLRGTITDISYNSGQFDRTPFPDDALPGAATDQGHIHAAETLRFAGEQLLRMAESNKLSPADGDHCQTYLSALESDPVNGTLLHFIANILKAEITTAIKEERLGPGDAAIAGSFLQLHTGFIEEFYPKVIQRDPMVDEVEVEEDISPETLANPLARLGGVLREEEDLITEELRDAFAELDRIREGFQRRKLLDLIEDQAAEDRILTRFVKKTIGLIHLFFVRVKERSLELSALAGGAGGVETVVPGAISGLLEKLSAIVRQLMEIFPSLF